MSCWLMAKCFKEWNCGDKPKTYNFLVNNYGNYNRCCEQHWQLKKMSKLKHLWQKVNIGALTQSNIFYMHASYCITWLSKMNNTHIMEILTTNMNIPLMTCWEMACILVLIHPLNDTCLGEEKFMIRDIITNFKWTS